jgi:hypothetical protein
LSWTLRIGIENCPGRALSHPDIFENVAGWIMAVGTRKGPDFVGRTIAAVIGWLGNPARFHFQPAADAGFVRAVTQAIERVLLRACHHADEIGSIAVGTEGDQIASVTSRTFDTMADEARHRWSECMRRASENTGPSVTVGKVTKSLPPGTKLQVSATEICARGHFWGASSQLGAENHLEL